MILARLLRIFCGIFAVISAAYSQPLTLKQAIDNALANYPSIRVSQEKIKAAAAGIELARTAYLPRIDILAQENRATRNNIFGTLLPQSVIAPITGPVQSANYSGVWDSALGGLITWEPFDFGAREASVNAANSLRAQQQATLKRTQFEIAAATADAYLTVIAAQATVRAAQAGVDRAETIAKTIKALVDATLRPGADESRAQAELAAAKTQLIQANQAVEVARANLAQFLTLEPAQITLAPQAFSQLPPMENAAPIDTSANPVSQEQNAVIEQLNARLKILERSYFPKFALQGAAFARGTEPWIDTPNYAIGFTVTFTASDIYALRARKEQQSAEIRAEQARYQQIAVELKARWNAAVAALNGARGVAANTPVQISSAKAASDQANARYQSGLGNVDAVAESQRLLTQAEIDDALARLSVWRALLQIATAAGDLVPFVTEVSQ